MKRNKYFEQFASKYYPWFLNDRANEFNHNWLIELAEFLQEASLIGKAHYEQIKDDLDYLSKVEPKPEIINWRAGNNFFLTLRNRDVRINRYYRAPFKLNN